MSGIPKSAQFLNESEVVSLFVESTGEDASSCYCKVCGRFLAHDEKFWYKNKTARADMAEPLACSNIKQTFLQTKVYNGHPYRRCVCNDCIKKKYPEYKGKLTCQSAFYVQYAFGVSNEDFQQVKRNVCCRTKESFIKSYGETEGLKRWNEYCRKQAETNTLEYKKEKYGWSEEQFDRYNKSRAVTLENMVVRHGEAEGHKKWDEYCAKQRYTCSLEYFVKQYGETEGNIKYQDYIQTLSDNYKNLKPVSDISRQCFQELSKYFTGNDIFYNEDEYTLGRYHLDYYDKMLNVVIEFNGDYWHMNPKKYSANDVNSVRSLTASEIWEFDKKRQDFIKSNLPGCIFIVVWEADYRQDPENCIKNVIKQINHVL